MPPSAPPDRQTIRNLQAEIAFREKLATQHVTGEIVLPDYYAKAEHDAILAERMADVSRLVDGLHRRGVVTSPFLELGAERGQRSLVLANDFGATGVAADISYHQLRAMEHFAEVFERPVLPLRVCCDATELPFRDESFPFVFCYQFLHHFPRLRPILQEIHRVLADGHFAFGEEPFRRVLKVRLYRQRQKIYAPARLRRHWLMRLVEDFVSEPWSDEVEHGVIENHDIPLAEWLDALSVFEAREVDLTSVLDVRSRLEDRMRPANVLNYLLGGSIAGLCRKRSEAAEFARTDVETLFGCPACTTPAGDGRLERTALREAGDGFECRGCGSGYPRVNDVVFLLRREKLAQLYPDIARRA